MLKELASIRIDIIPSVLLFLGILIGTVISLTLWSWFRPKQLLAIIKETRELKQLDNRIAHDLRNTGFITKLAFRTFSKNTERYF